jgi:hypothetical protein
VAGATLRDPPPLGRMSALKQLRECHRYIRAHIDEYSTVIAEAQPKEPCPECLYEQRTGKVAPVDHSCETEPDQYDRPGHEPNGDLAWRERYAAEYRRAEGEGLQPWQAREQASRAAWRDYEERTGQPAHWRNGASWGRLYGGDVPYRTPDGKLVRMFRKGQRVRFIDADGEQVGPEQSNVGPALAYAAANRWREVTGHPSHDRNGMPAGFDSFDAADVFGDEVQEASAGASLPGAVFDGVKRGDVLQVGAQRYEVLQVWDNYHAMVQKPGAKRKAFALRQDRRPEGEVVEVREQRGTPETTLAGPVLATVPLDAVERVGAHRPMVRSHESNESDPRDARNEDMRLALAAAGHGNRTFSVRELTEHLQGRLPSNAVRYQVSKLARSGYITFDESGTIGVTKLGWDWIEGAPRHASNATSYYVWVLARGSDSPIDEGPYGPYDLDGAKTFARIGATEGAHDRAVSAGVDPKAASFEIVRRYRARTGERVL